MVKHESKNLQFNEFGNPLRSGDDGIAPYLPLLHFFSFISHFIIFSYRISGFGLLQLTNPVPTLEQVWNWKANLDGGNPPFTFLSFIK